MRIIIFLSGPYQKGLFSFQAPRQRPDLVLCADGGASHAYAEGLVPDLILGDMDSVSPELLAYFVEKKVPIKVFDRKKDFTDGELALTEALERIARGKKQIPREKKEVPRHKNQIPREKKQIQSEGKFPEDEIIFLGALGGRLDHVLSHMQLLIQVSRFNGLHGTAVRAWIASASIPEERIYILDNTNPLCLQGSTGDSLSVLPLTDAQGICGSNLEYPLQNKNLRLGSVCGVSNVFIGEEVKLQLREGLLLVIHTRQSPA